MIERSMFGDLAEVPPGPDLGAALAAIDRSRLNGHDLVTVMQARARQVAHEQAQLLADMVEVAHCPPGDWDSPVERISDIAEFAADEIRAALRLTRRAADSALSLAVDLVERLPEAYAALLAGTIDLPRARLLGQETAMLPRPAARHVVSQVIGAAPTLTTGQLAARVRKAVLAVDPEAARRRQERSVAERRLHTELDRDGTATLAGCQLPVERAAAAAARVDALARAAKLSGDDRSLDQLRADTFLDLLEGAGGASAEGRAPTGGRGGVELRVPLTTLMGLSEQPGELVGWGPVIGEVARQVAERGHGSPWRVSVYDHSGRLVHHGPVRRRPTAAQAEFVKARDRTCRAPGCRAPASRADVDHTRQFARGGPTSVGNLGVLCRHDHRLKDSGGWGLQQLEAGVFIWRSRLGHRYAVPPDRPDPP